MALQSGPAIPEISVEESASTPRPARLAEAENQRDSITSLSSVAWSDISALPGRDVLTKTPSQNDPNSQNRGTDENLIERTEEKARELLTKYKVYSLRKKHQPGFKFANKATWARVECIEQPAPQEEIQKSLEKLRAEPRSVLDKKTSLFPNQQAHVTKLLGELNETEQDKNFEWTLEQIERMERLVRTGLRDTSAFTLYVKRAPKDSVNCGTLLHALDEAHPPPPPPPSPKLRKTKGAAPVLTIFDKPIWNWPHVSDTMYDENVQAFTAVDCYSWNSGPWVSTKSISDVQRWLKKYPAPPNSKSLQEGSRGLKLIFQEQEEAEIIPFPRDVIHEINYSFNLPAVDTHRSSKVSGTHGKFMMRENHPAFVMWRTDSNETISTVISYNPTTNITSGYILYTTDFDMTDLIPKIAQQYSDFSHPLIIPLLMTELMIDYLTSEVVLVDQKLEELEIKTRKLEREDRNQTNISNHADYRPLAFDLGEQASNFAHLKARVETAISSQEFLLMQMKWMEEMRMRKEYAKLDDSGPLIQDRIMYTLENLKQMLQYRGIENRLQAHQNYLSSLIAQQDNATNLRISRFQADLSAQSRNDSSAMKTIALLTTLFLPGTFISTMFAMPILDFNSHGLDKFWIYWAATIPLTAVVMVVVFLLILPPEENPVVSLYRMFSPGYRKNTNSNVDVYGVKPPGDSDDVPESEVEEFSVKGGISTASIDAGDGADEVQSARKRLRWRIFGHSAASDEEAGTKNDGKRKLVKQR